MDKKSYLAWAPEEDILNPSRIAFFKLGSLVIIIMGPSHY